MPLVETGASANGTLHELRCYHPVPAGTGDRELVQLARSATHTETPHVFNHQNVEETS
jgi:peptide/nickel transport system ATP-binding protein